MKKSGAAVFLISLLLIFTGTVVFASKTLNALYLANDTNIKGIDLGEGNVIEQRVPNELLFLLVGLDEDDSEVTGQDHSRTDTMMLVKANFESGKVDIISIPRDSKVLVNGKYDKINHAHAYGGMVNTMQTIINFLNIDLDYFVTVDFEAVEEIVDAIGGVVVHSPHRIQVPQVGVDIPEGEVRLNGKEALQFVRHRSGFVTGDLGRIENQQNFMKDLAAQILKPQNIAKLPSMLEVYKDNVKTNIPSGTIATLLPKAVNIKIDEMESHTIPGTDGYETVHGKGVSYFFPDKEKTKKLVKEVLGDYMLDGERSFESPVQDDEIDRELNQNKKELIKQ